ncbi:hypothetical protein OQA88_7140 [Cercophora sp. LCS_1]
MAILSMITRPANTVMTTIPRLVAAFASFDRVQSFLIKPSFTDTRIISPEPTEKRLLEFEAQETKTPKSAVQLRNVSIGKHPTTLLQNVTFDLLHGFFTIITGPVGCGKSTLLITVLGEENLIGGSMRIRLKRVAYYSQRPWIPSGTIKHVIHGVSKHDQEAEWYNRVIAACCLDHDISLLPDKDGTQVGSGGLNLSGGQGQRLALARALFTKPELILLDDVFSGLDRQTEANVFRNLFDRAGLCRQLNASVLLVTSSTSEVNDMTSAPLSFFSKSDSGSILNRFSQDLQLIDKKLPDSLSNLAMNVFKLLTQGLMLCILQPSLSLSFPAVAGLLYLIQKVYLRVSRQLRLLELESRANVLTGVVESIQGLETIRAFGWIGDTIQETLFRLENSQRPEFLLMCLQRWLSLVLDLTAAGLFVAIVVSAIAWREQFSGGQLGVALNLMLLAHPTLLRLVEAWTHFEVSLGAIARLKTLEESTPSEDDSDVGNMNMVLYDKAGLPPRKGRIDFEGVTAGYEQVYENRLTGGIVALRNVTFRLEAGHKMVICGRTGSGKSSLLLAMLRMVELQSGSIKLDGVNISSIPRNTLRQRCFVVVSQDALVLAHETLRFNLDPEGLSLDPNLVGALQRVGLWRHFCSALHLKADADAGIAASQVLNTVVSKFPGLSGGQEQLLGICRGVIKAERLRAEGGKPVVLLNEVSSALDATTAAAVHGIIQTEFAGHGHTVIMISHRLFEPDRSAQAGKETVVFMQDGVAERVVDSQGL